MKIFSFILIIFLVVFMWITSATSFTKDEVKEIVNRAPYLIEEYRIGKFDCSNMSHLLHDWLDMHDIEAKIILTYWEDKDGIPYGHAYLLVEDTWYVDAVHKQIIDRRSWIKDSYGYEDAVDPRNIVGILEDADVLHWLGINSWEYAKEWGYPEDRLNKEDK